MENIFLTSLTTPEIRQLFRQELEEYFKGNDINVAHLSQDETPVTQHEICRFLNITEPTLIRWRKKGRIPFIKIGSRVLYQKAAVIAALGGKEGGKR